MLVVDRVELRLLDQPQQVRELHRDHAAGREQDAACPSTKSLTRARGRARCCRRSGRPAGPRPPAACRLAAEELDERRDPALLGDLGHVRGRLDPEHRHAAPRRTTAGGSRRCSRSRRRSSRRRARSAESSPRRRCARARTQLVGDRARSRRSPRRSPRAPRSPRAGRGSTARRRTRAAGRKVSPCRRPSSLRNELASGDVLEVGEGVPQGRRAEAAAGRRGTQLDAPTASSSVTSPSLRRSFMHAQAHEGRVAEVRVGEAHPLETLREVLDRLASPTCGWCSGRQLAEAGEADLVASARPAPRLPAR